MDFSKKTANTRTSDTSDRYATHHTRKMRSTPRKNDKWKNLISQKVWHAKRKVKHVNVLRILTFIVHVFYVAVSRLWQSRKRNPVSEGWKIARVIGIKSWLSLCSWMHCSTFCNSDMKCHFFHLLLSEDLLGQVYVGSIENKDENIDHLTWKKNLSLTLYQSISNKTKRREL